MTIDGDNQALPTEETIAIRAYQKYIERGREQGHDVEDWLAAEAEIRAQLSEAMAEMHGELSSTTAASAAAHGKLALEPRPKRRPPGRER